MAIGPDGKYLRGSPINPRDRGGLNAGFTVNKRTRHGIMEFGTAVNWLAGSPDELLRMATMIRSKCIQTFGKLPYDKSTLPIRVIANRDKGVVELYLPATVEVLVANPEVWLALSDEIETTVASMKK